MNDSGRRTQTVAKGEKSVMSAAKQCAELWLVIKPYAGDWGQYVLEAYDTVPTGSDRPAASALLARLDYTRLGKALTHIFQGDDDAPQQMGDYLVEWLFVEAQRLPVQYPWPLSSVWSFVEQEDAAPQPRHPTTSLPYNSVGMYVQHYVPHGSHSQPLRVWICVDQALAKGLEFQGYLPFACLDHNSHFPLRVVRGAVRSSGPGFAVTIPAAPLAVADKLRVLLVYANPTEKKAPSGVQYPHLKDLARHFDALCKALDPLVHAGELFIEELRNPTPKDLRAALVRFTPHVLVFAGHGYASGGGGLVCVEDGAPALWPFPQLVQALQETNEPALRLTVLIACRGFVAAPTLLTAGVPAVVAMQPLGGADFPEAGVSAFAEPFFNTLAHYGPITEAYANACRSLAASAVPYAALMPTLWLATTQDQLFESPEQRLHALYLDALLGKPEVALLPFPGREEGVALNALYVEQTVVEEKREQQADAAPHGGGSERALQAAVMQEVVKRVPVDVWEKLKEQHWVRIEAPAWTGKSTLCRWVVKECKAQTGWLPIFISFREFTQSGKSIQRYVQEDYAEWLGLQGRQLEVELPDGRTSSLSVGQWLFNLWQAGRALLILDGADEEFDAKRRAQALASLPAAQERTIRPRVLLTSRPLGEGGVLGFEKVELQEFASSQIENLVRRCGQMLGTQDKAERFIADMRQSAHGRALQLAARPGHLVQMFATYVQEGMLLTAEDELMDRVAKRRLTIITGRVTPPLVPDEPVYKRQVIEAVSFHLLFCRQGHAQEREQMLQLVGGALMAVRLNGAPIYQPEDAGTMLGDLCRNSSFLKETQKGAYELESVPWLQFFAACYLARNAQGTNGLQWRRWLFEREEFTCDLCHKSLPPFNHYFWHTEWQEVVVLLTGVLGDAAPLLQRLQAEPADVFHQMLTLAACCLGSAKEAGQKVAGEIVEVVCQEWRKTLGTGRSFGTVALGALIRGRQERWAEQVRAFLCARLEDEAGFVRGAAAEALGELKDSRAVPDLLAALKDKDEAGFVREAAAWALGELGHAGAALPLLSAVKRHRDERRLWEALRTLSQRARIRIYEGGKWQSLPSVDLSSDEVTAHAARGGWTLRNFFSLRHLLRGG